MSAVHVHAPVQDANDLHHVRSRTRKYITMGADARPSGTRRLDGCLAKPTVGAAVSAYRRPAPRRHPEVSVRRVGLRLTEACPT